MMTATATKATVRTLKSQLPEIQNWKDICYPPVRDNVLFIVPPPETFSADFRVILKPFIKDMCDGTPYLFIARGIQVFPV